MGFQVWFLGNTFICEKKMDTKVESSKLQDDILVGLIMANFTTREMVEHYETKGASGDYWLLKEKMEKQIREWLVKFKNGCLTFS